MLSIQAATSRKQHPIRVFDIQLQNSSHLKAIPHSLTIRHSRDPIFFQANLSQRLNTMLLQTPLQMINILAGAVVEGNLLAGTSTEPVRNNMKSTPMMLMWLL